MWHKDSIIMNLKDYHAGRRASNGTNSFNAKIEELENVYTQASKADEYEAKAKAFDEVLKSYEESISEGHLSDDVCNIVEKYNKQEEIK